MSKKSFREKRGELKRINEVYDKLKDYPENDQKIIRYRLHMSKLKVSTLYRAKWFIITTFEACIDLCKYLLTEKIFKSRDNRRS